jgi:hypothetical protein
MVTHHKNLISRVHHHNTVITTQASQHSQAVFDYIAAAGLRQGKPLRSSSLKQGKPLRSLVASEPVAARSPRRAAIRIVVEARTLGRRRGLRTRRAAILIIVEASVEVAKVCRGRSSGGGGAVDSDGSRRGPSRGGLELCSAGTCSPGRSTAGAVSQKKPSHGSRVHLKDLLRP